MNLRASAKTLAFEVVASVAIAVSLYVVSRAFYR